jgi:hypothetical protein
MRAWFQGQCRPRCLAGRWRVKRAGDVVDAAPTMEQRRWTAPRHVVASTALLGGAWALMAFGLVGAAVVTHGSLGARVFCSVVLLPVGVVGARCAIRATRASVTVGPDGVAIVGLMRSRQVPLSEVDRFVADFNGSYSQSCVTLARVRGRRYPLWVTSRGIASVATSRTRERLSQLSAELNAALAEAKTQS